MNVYQHMALDGFGDAGTLHFARLEDHVAIGKDNRPRPTTKTLEDVERSRVESIGERVIH